MEKKYFNELAISLNVYKIKIIKIPSEIKGDFIFKEVKEFWCDFIFVNKEVLFLYQDIEEIEIEYIYL
tara:strand:- start:67 stop:270 length:204 start_codon:yes stop_codon:yes gene_type:complete